VGSTASRRAHLLLRHKTRPGAKRTIDFKAALATAEDRISVKIRDVIAIFSQSQLHCLGLSLFLARAVHEQTGFIVLDDPVLSSDETYRAFFNTAVVEELLARGFQLVILTQDQKTLKELETRYMHLGIATFELTIQNPLEGATVSHISDTLETLLARGKVLARTPNRDLRKQAGITLRLAAERFCKELLVKNKPDSLVTNFDGPNLGELVQKTEPLLIQDGGHPGKLRTIPAALNPANHDDGAPGSSVLKQAISDLADLKKRYLR
jgi:hypothetical protein